DNKGQLVASLYQGEVEYVTLYDKGGRDRASIDQSGIITHYRYDSAGQLVETVYGDTVGLKTFLEEMELLDGYQLQEYTLDAIDWTKVLYPVDMPARVVGLDAPRYQMEYSQDGYILATVDQQGNRTEYQYDDARRMVAIRTFEDEQVYETETIYDKAGNVISQIDALGRKTEYKYDKLEQLIETLFHDGTSIKNQYDSSGNLIARTDQEGRTTQYKYDALDQLVEVINPQLESTIYDYDELGNLIYQKDAENQETYFEYDNLGRQTAIERPLKQRSSTTYNQVGNILTTIDFNGNTIHYQYNEVNRLISKTLEGESQPFIEYDYHPTGQLQTVEDERGTTSFLYNERGQLESRTEPDGSRISYTYNAVGLVETVTTSSGTITYKYDPSNRLVEVIEPDPTQKTIYEYDFIGNLTKTTYPNGVIETKDYDDLNRLTGVTYQDKDQNIIASYTYTLDRVGNSKVVEESGGRKIEYDYDESYRLIEEKITDPVNGDLTIEYSYDNVGNRIAKKVTTEQVTVETTYQYDDNDRLQSETTNGITTDYTYDKNGNLILENVLGSTEKVEYFWDLENRLIAVNLTDDSGATQNIEYEYNARGIRVSETVDGGETIKYLIDEVRPYAQVLEEYTGKGETRDVQASYLYGTNLISQQLETEEFFYLEDGHSGVRKLVDENGIVTDTYNYDAYGNVLLTTGANENNYLYRAEQYNSHVDLQYLRARYYNPEMGRFISVDPFSGILEEPTSRHRYLYGNANPVTYSDPSGLISSTALAARNAIEINLQTRVAVTLYAMVSTIRKRFKKPIQWDGVIGSGSLSIPNGPPELSFGPVGTAANLYLTSECVAHDSVFGGSTSPFGEKLEGGIWTLVGGGVAVGELYFGATGGPITAYSPREFGIDPYVFTPVWGGGGLNLAFGVLNLDGLLIGKGWTGTPGRPGVALLTGDSFSVIGGLSWYWPGSGKKETCLEVNPTP
ncbi:MAG: hypothetical protein J7524_22885, partial [Roseofilum sp. Belize BBD 4]|uniref:RHS repeat-associated core domain-containing protein n=2 Tax=unclassified Roseofilum TaxID=2620099 RepID=UPI001B0567A6